MTNTPCPCCDDKGWVENVDTPCPVCKRGYRWREQLPDYKRQWQWWNYFGELVDDLMTTDEMKEDRLHLLNIVTQEIERLEKRAKNE